jgi:hypothetical protein
MGNFRTTRTSGVERARETLFSFHCSESTHGTATARRQLLKAAAGGPPRDSLVTVPGDLVFFARADGIPDAGGTSAW